MQSRENGLEGLCGIQRTVGQKDGNAVSGSSGHKSNRFERGGLYGGAVAKG